MLLLRSGLNLFPFITAEHSFYEHIQHLRSQLIEAPLYQKMRQRIGAAGETCVRISMKAHPLTNSIWALEGFYFSLQFKERLSSRFHASTFFCSAKTGSIESFEFPQDPYLTALATHFNTQNFHKNDHETGLGLDVLRYYPRKRLTFRTNILDDNATPAIGKFVRRSNIEETHNKLVEIYRIVARSPSNFSVAAPLGIDANNGLFLQEARPGKALADLINKENFCNLLYTVGRIHRELHRLDVPDLKKLDFGAFLRNLIICIEWISLFRPKERSFFDNVRNLLVKHVPRVDPIAYTFCHGDFSCLQIINDHDSCSVIDFDDCILGDPYLEIGRLIAFLKYDVPLFRDCFIEPKQWGAELLEQASGAYLNGYQEKAQQTFNEKRLLWYRICFEIHYLARLFKRDLFHPLAFERTLKIIHDLSERLSQEKGSKGGVF